MEDVYVLNENNFQSEGLIDAFESFIWVDRYSSYGDFELYTTITKKYLELIKQDKILWIEDSEHSMFVEKVEIISDVENGNYLLVSGKSLESILKRRIIWTQTILNGNLQDCVERLINDSIINPSISQRKIDNFIFERTDDPEITKLTYEGQFTGDELYEAIVQICDSVDIGFKIIIDNKKKQFVFKLYRGEDRSYSQTKNPYVIFSPKFENIINSNYLNDNSSYKNITLVAGEGEGNERKTVTVGDNNLVGLKRRELFTDARDISSRDGDRTISDSEYNQLLTTRGNEKLKENKNIKLFDGEVDTTKMYRYGKDFYMGDITQLESEYFSESRVRVVEFIHSIDKTGIKNYPTFEVVEEDEEKEAS